MQPRAKRQAFGLALIYVIAGGAWVVVSEAVLKRFTSSLDECIAVGAIQALVFVVATGGFLYLIWRRLQRQWEQQMEQREESGKNLRRTERALKTISACNGVLVRAASEADLLSEICRVVVETGGFRMAWVGFPENDESKSVRIAARAGCDEGYLQKSGITWSDASERGRGPAGTSIRTGQIVVSNNFLLEPQTAPWREEAAKRGYGSIIALPLPHAEKTLGVLTIYAAEAQSFNSTEIELLKELADDLAYGIQALRTQIERAQAEKAQQLFRALIERAGDGIHVVDPATGRFLDVNESACRSLGYTRDELLSLAAFDVAVGLDQAMFNATHIEMKKTGQLTLEILHRRKDGTTYPAEISLSPVTLDREYLVAITRDNTQRRQAAETLRESEQKFSKMFHSSPLPMALSTIKEGRYLDANHEFLKLLQRSREEVVGHTSLELNVWSNIEQRAAMLAKLADGEMVRNVELQVRRPSGQIRQILWSAEPLEVGGERCWLGSSLDITEQKHADELLRQERELYLDLVNNQPAGIYRIRVSPKDQHRKDAWTNSEHAPYCFELASDRFCEILGVQREVFTTHPGIVIDLVHPDDKAKFAWQNEAANISLMPFRWDGRLVIAGKVTWVHFESLPRPAANGDMIWTGILYDITEQKHAEDQMRLQSTALTAAANAILITDRQGRIEWVNPAFSQLTGYGPAEAIGHNPRILKSGQHPPEFYAHLWTTVTAGNVWHGEMVNQRKDGRIIIEDTIITPVRDANGEIAHFVAIKQDITQARQLEAQLRQSQKMEAIGQLAGGVAHDFNNILASLIMQAELVEMADSLPAEVTEGLKQIRADAMRAAQLTRQLLLFSRRQVLQSCQLDLNEVVTNLAKMLQRIIGEDVRLQLNLHPAPLMTCADGGMVEQMLMNLAVNARDAMPQGGRLGIETEEKIVTEDLAGLCPDAPPGRYVGFSVSDTGTGIPPEILPQIFEPFFTTKPAGKGTGLGLATVFGIVKLHRGWLKVDNQPGQGVTIRIFLPASTATAEEAAQAEAKPGPRGGNETILLVEDEAAVRKSLGSLLERHGYQVVAAANGIEALDLWLTHRGKVALLLTDLVMPGGMTGYELAQQLQSGQPKLKTIYMSGYSAEIAGREIKLRPGEIFLQKPCAADQLFEAIRRSLDG